MTPPAGKWDFELTRPERVINLQMEGSSGSPGPNESKLSYPHVNVTRLIRCLADTLYQARNVEAVSYNP